ncbi:hypothetical protein BT93_F0473 [Corymbia citriodora subsp. variegata]|nr:hypothetical protein BT93_F0473 [Corymbia citriodora subsp. variegata]
MKNEGVRSMANNAVMSTKVEKEKILIFGAGGYLGKLMVKASLSMGHPTLAYVRSTNPDPSKKRLLHEFELMNVTIVQVDVVISTLPVPQHLQQLKIIDAIKEAPNIQRFVPSEYGNEVDRVRGALPPFEALLENKRKIRRATEVAGIPFTYVSANSFAAYFVNYLLHPNEQRDHVVVRGTGEAKAVLNYEEDVAFYTIKAATDPRVANRVIIYRPPGNIVSQLDLISLWEKKTGRTLRKMLIPEEDVVKLTESLPYPDNIREAILHNIFIKGEQTSFDLTENDMEASALYPDHSYTSVDSLLDLCLLSPPKPKLASFA